MDNQKDNLDAINEEYGQLATLIGDIEAKLAVLTQKKTALLKRVFELDALAGQFNSEGPAR